jgi:arsenate reductase
MNNAGTKEIKGNAVFRILVSLKSGIVPIADRESAMFDVLVISECTFGKNLIASAYLKDLGSNYFKVECAGFDAGPLYPMVPIVMKLDGYDLGSCEDSRPVSELLEMGQTCDIMITVCSKRLDAKCPDFPGQLLRLNWRHSDPDKIAESRIDRIQQLRTMRDNIKADVINFIHDYEKGALPALK